MDEKNIAYIILAVIIAAIIAVFVILAVKGRKDIIYKIIFALVNEAEAAFGSKTGKLKFAYVIERVYEILPPIVRLFISYNMLEKLIEKALEEAKEYWAEQVEATEEMPTVSGFAQK